MVQENPSLVIDPRLLKILADDGWDLINGSMLIHNNGTVFDLKYGGIELIDAIFMFGWLLGLQRGIYEITTMEDCEKAEADVLQEMRDRYKKGLAIPTEV